MHLLKVSAQFAAFVWYRNHSRGADKAEAHRFARENWLRFLPRAHEGWGKLLVRVAKLRPAKGRRVRPGHAACRQEEAIRDMAEAS
jgi:hypothetical protein